MDARDRPLTESVRQLRLAQYLTPDMIERLDMGDEVKTARREADLRLRKASCLLKTIGIDLPDMMYRHGLADLLSFVDEDAIPIPYAQARRRAVAAAPPGGRVTHYSERHRHFLVAEHDGRSTRTLCRYYSGYGAETGSWWFCIRDVDVEEADFVAYLVCDGAGEIQVALVVPIQALRDLMSDLKTKDDSDRCDMCLKNCGGRLRVVNDPSQRDLTPWLNKWASLWE